MVKSSLKIWIIFILSVALSFAIAFSANIYLQIDFLAVFTCIISIILAIALCVLWHKFCEISKEKRILDGVLMELPLRVGIYDRSGHILLHYSYDERKVDFSSIKKIRDLPGIINNPDLFINDIIDTFKSGVRKDRIFSSSKRRVTYGKLPEDLFGCDTVFSCSWDVSFLYTARENADKRERLYNALVDALSDGVLLLSPDGRISYTNSYAERIIGIEKTGILGMEYKRVFAPIYTKESLLTDDPIDKILKNGGKFESKNLAKLSIRGENMSISLKCESIFDKDGKTEAVIIIFRDISISETERIVYKKLNEISELAFELAEVSHFSINLERGVLEYGSGNIHFWPIKDGMPMPEQLWIYSGDYEKFKLARKRLVSGEDKIWDTVYRSDYFGSLSWYRIRAVIKKEKADTFIVGTIQDISLLYDEFIKIDVNASMLEMIMKSLPCIFFIKDISNDYRYVMYSDKGLEIFGYKLEDVIGKTDFDIFKNSEVARVFRKQDQAANNSQVPTEAYSDVFDKDKKLRRFHTVEVAYPTKDGRKFLYGICFDETAEKEVYDEQERRRMFYQNLFDKLPIGIAVKDIDNGFKYIMWNKFLEAQTGYSKSQVMGKTDFEIEPYIGESKNIRQMDLKSAESPELFSFDKNYKTALGGNVAYRSYKTSISDGKRKLAVDIRLDVSHESELKSEQLNAISKMNEQITNTSMVNACLRRLSRENYSGNAIKDMLNILASSVFADRCYIYKYSDDYKSADCVFEWVRNSARPRKYRSGVDMQKFVSLNSAVKNKTFIRLEELLKKEDEKNVYSDFFESGYVRSALIGGICENDRIYGFLGLDIVSEGKKFPESSKRILLDAISIFLLAQQRERILDEVRDAAKLQKMIIDNIRIPVVLLNIDFTVVHLNPAALGMIGMPVDDVLKSSCYSSFCKCDKPPEYCSILRTLKSAKQFTAEIKLNNTTYTLNTIPIFRHGKVAQILETFIDMSDIEKNKELLRKTAKIAEETARAKSMFLATMSHELRTPLNAVIGFAELLKLDGISQSEMKEAVNSIYLSATLLLQLINDVLDLSKLEAGQMKIIPVMTDLRGIFDELRSIFELRLKKRGLSYLMDIQADLPFMSIDNLRFRQVLLNIIGNAVKFTQKGGIKIEVQFKKEDAKNGTLCIMIRDTGIGIAPEYLDSIFSPFVREETREGPVYQGTGLGLPICKKLVEKMNGTLEVKSTVGIGSCFIIKIPNLEYAAGMHTSVSDRKNSLQRDSINARVMIVDDVPMNLKVLESMARKLGVETFSADSAETALSSIESFNPDFILTDMWMPKMNGKELAQFVRKGNLNQHIKIVAVTADSEFENPQSVFDGILFKPVTLKKLQQLLVSLTSPVKASNDSKNE